MLKAANAYPGWGLSDWWNNRYVMLSCIDHRRDCEEENVVAYFDTQKRDYEYPTVVFCELFFKNLTSHSDAVSNIDKNKDLQQNVANLRSQATTFFHELLHINWGTAQECAGKRGCTDHWQDIGGKLVPTYKTGRAKLLAQRDVEQAAWNNDNYAYYSMVKFMEKRWKEYPKYPAMWDPTKSKEDNEKREKSEPGAPPSVDALDEEGANYDEDVDGPGLKDPVYPSSAYPEWYQPLINSTFDVPTPDVSQPTDNILNYYGPNIEDVTCETSDGSPGIDDCVSAFGSLRIFPDQGALHGQKGGTWWASVSNIL